MTSTSFMWSINSIIYLYQPSPSQSRWLADVLRPIGSTHKPHSFVWKELPWRQPWDESIILLLLKEKLNPFVKSSISSTLCDKTFQNKLTFFWGGVFFGLVCASATHSRELSGQRRDLKLAAVFIYIITVEMHTDRLIISYIRASDIMFAV